MPIVKVPGVMSASLSAAHASGVADGAADAEAATLGAAEGAALAALGAEVAPVLLQAVRTTASRAMVAAGKLLRMGSPISGEGERARLYPAKG